jgi:hypothetical protein
MALLTYTVLASDITLWGTLDAIRANLSVSGTKMLQIALDPLIDPTIVNPGDGYTVT